MKAAKRIYIIVLTIVSLLILFLPALHPMNNAAFAVCAFLGSLGIIAVIHFLQFNEL